MKARLVWLLLCGIWGSTWLFIKLGLADLPPFSFAGIRFVIACAIIYGLIRARGIQLPVQRRDWLLLAASGVLSFTINYGLIFWAEQHISSGLAALLQATTPAFGLVIAHLHLPSERMTWPKIIGVVLGVFGVGVVFSNQLSIAGGLALAGCVGVVFSSICVAYSNVLIKAWQGFDAGGTRRRSDVLWFNSALAYRYSARGESYSLSLDAVGPGITVLSGNRGISDRVSALLLARTSHGRDKNDVDLTGHASRCSVARHGGVA